MRSPSAESRLDAVVVGSGPAGAIAAAALARRGARVVLLERHSLPRYKTCGGGLVARGLAGLPADLELEPERECRKIELNLLDDGQRHAVERGDPLVTMTMRADLDCALVRSAERAGAELRAPCAFEGLREESAGLVVRTSRGELRTSFLIGADGVASLVARHAGWPPLAGIPAIECELAVDPATLERFAPTVRFDFAEPASGYGWVFPKRGHLSVGLLDMRRGAGGLKAQLARYLERIGLRLPVEARIHGHPIPVRPRAGGMVRGRVLLAGDAAGLADPVTGEGISWAIRSGQLLAAAWTEGGQDPHRVGRAYAEALDREILGELRLARILSRFLYGHPRLRRTLFRWRGQALGKAMAEVTLGRRTYRGLLGAFPNYLRLLQGGAHPVGRPTPGH